MKILPKKLINGDIMQNLLKVSGSILIISIMSIPTLAITKSSELHKIGFTGHSNNQCIFWLPNDTIKNNRYVLVSSAIPETDIYMNIDGYEVKLNLISTKRTDRNGKIVNNINGSRTIRIYQGGGFQVKQDITLIDSQWNYRGNITVSRGKWEKIIKVKGFCDYFG
jgi:hypothetical protein